MFIDRWTDGRRTTYARAFTSGELKTKRKRCTHSSKSSSKYNFIIQALLIWYFLCCKGSICDLYLSILHIFKTTHFTFICKCYMSFNNLIIPISTYCSVLEEALVNRRLMTYFNASLAQQSKKVIHKRGSMVTALIHLRNISYYQHIFDWIQNITISLSVFPLCHFYLSP